MASPKTQPTDANVTEFLDQVTDARRRDEGHRVRDLMEKVTGEPAVMWGPSIVGFGSAPIATTTGSNDWPIVAFSPRKGALTLYGLHEEEPDPLFDALGPHTLSVGCLYIKRLDAVDETVLEQLVAKAWAAYR